MFRDEAELDAAARWVDGWQDRIEQQAARARELGERVRAMTVTVRGADDLVEVTLSSSGALSGLRLSDSLRRQPAAEIAEQILQVARTASDRLAERISAATAETLGADSAAGQAMIDSYARRASLPSTELGHDR
ncbi:YbaB/EbfC family nucleoid-associated protein [Plantactinospora sp. KBS50]|uniref:YbaB/EbfC family nucleoid-associated protein n=1 Tax=Plantactinospora sp. KBS50 TaxID=2024580 RepID=UPI000BAAEC65|nr:YbaB/EbfC family nucleoid-associated protein [Plantactinospora sp. KBS50]ASW57129.1 hypothetical protein CIK06_27770 [Plantactinospora sp. KBS50]